MPENARRANSWPPPSTKKALPGTKLTFSLSARSNSSRSSTPGTSIHRKKPPRGEVHLTRAGEVCAERALHDRALCLVMRSQTRRDAIDDPAGQRAVDDALIEDAAGNVGGLLAELHLLRDRRRRNHPRHAQARDQDLREAAQVHDPAIARRRP